MASNKLEHKSKMDSSSLDEAPLVENPEAPVVPPVDGLPFHPSMETSSPELLELLRYRLSPEFYELSSDMEWLNDLDQVLYGLAVLSETYERKFRRMHDDIVQAGEKCQEANVEVRRQVELGRADLVSRAQQMNEIERQLEHESIRELERQTERYTREHQELLRIVLERGRRSSEQYRSMLKRSCDLFLSHLRAASAAEHRQHNE